MPRVPLHCFAALAVLPLCAIVARSDSGYTSRTWTTDDGLPHNSVGRIAQDAVGHLWLGTVGGLARFDGSRFTEIVFPEVEAPSGLNVRGLERDPKGGILALVPGGRVLRVDGEQVTVHPCSAATQQLTTEPVDLFVEPGGAIWLGNSAGQLLRWNEDGTTQVFGREHPVARRTKRFTFAIDTHGATWIGSDSFLAEFREGELVRWPDSPDEPLLIAAGRDGAIWICTAHQLLRLHHRQLSVECAQVPWRDDFDSVRHLCERPDGDLWITGRRSLYRFTGGELKLVDTPYSLASFLMEDREGNLWVATDGSGLGQLCERSYALFDEDAGLQQDGVSTLSEDLNGRIWLANRAGGLAYLDGERIRAFGDTDPPLPVEVVLADRDGNVWFGGTRAGLWRIAHGESAPRQVLNPPGGIRLLFESHTGEVWFATGRNQIGRHRRGEFQLFSEAENFRAQNIQAIAEDSSGLLWLGGRSGDLLCWDGTRFAPVEGRPIHHPIHALHADRDGRLWLATAGGLQVKQGDRFTRFGVAHGLPDEIVHAILEDDRDHLWIAARRGLFYLAKADLLALASGETTTRATAYTYGRDEGLRGFSLAANFQPAVARARDGALWFATTRGAVRVDPDRLPRDLPPPPLLLGTVTFDGTATRHARGESLRIPPGTHRVAIQLLALSFTAPENVVVRYTLAGVDRAWLETGPDRIASYQNLAPGSYTLRAKARNSAGVWSHELSVPLIVVPAWWETLAFRLAAALAAAVLLAWVVRVASQRRLRIRLRGLAQAHALERERARIARDLHDDLGVSLTEVGLLADRLVGSAPATLGAQLSLLARRTRRLSTDLSSIVWTINTRDSSLDKLARFLRTYAERLFRHSEVACRVTGVESIPALPLAPDLQHQLLAVTKEALNNVIKHSRAREAVIRMEYEHEIFLLAVTDNGVGIATDPGVVFEGNGLRNMSARLEEFGGTVTIAGKPRAGTVVTIRVRIVASEAAALS